MPGPALMVTSFLVTSLLVALTFTFISKLMSTSISESISQSMSDPVSMPGFMPVPTPVSMPVSGCSGAPRVHRSPPRHVRYTVMVLLFMSSGALSGCVAPAKPIVSTAANLPRAGGPANEVVASRSSESAVAEATRRGPVAANAIVEHVTDGDTISVTFIESNQVERIRLIGIDTPETKKPNTPIECFGREASNSMKALLPVGTEVMIERDVEERDRYGRLLGYVIRAQDGLFINLEMVRVGMALPYTFPPNVTYTDEFVKAGDAARSADVGLWTRCESGHDPAHS